SRRSLRPAAATADGTSHENAYVEPAGCREVPRRTHVGARNGDYSRNVRRGDPLVAARSSGVLLHPTSLPGGRLGSEAYAFVDWLATAGQTWWQVLPLGPPDPFGSPYTSPSAFAGWRELLADPETKVTDDELADYRRRHSYWIYDWERYAGADATADQVRFDREWRARRAYPSGRGTR